MSQEMARRALDYLVPAGWVLDTGDKVMLPHILITVAGIRTIENLLSGCPPQLADDIRQQAAPTEASPDERPCALLVEDEFLVRIVVADALRELGFTVEDVPSAAGALDRLQLAQSRIAVAVIDIGLPDLNGAMLVRQIRAGQPELPIVVASGRSPALMRRQIDADAQLRFLQKPYGANEMRLVLDSLGLKTASLPAGDAH
ncbi:MAG TPA: response regulator [Ferrovibrio sp.]|uniref:response regulator n=1 Tax=Ferrovibrio sp. TaxID=1917215 RepID=UPI002ED65638